MLALYLGFSIGLPRPYWALATVYIIAHPLSGAVRSKAVYRAIGTLLGAGAAVAVAAIPSVVDSPIWLSLALAIWSGLCLFISLLDRTPRAYIFMLAGYTTAIIGFPCVLAPDTVFDVAVSRAEEILLGIICASLTHSLFFPRQVIEVLGDRVNHILSDASAWVRGALNERCSVEMDRERRRLASHVTELHMLSTHLPFDTMPAPLKTRAVHALEDRLSVLLPLATAVEGHLEALEANGHPLEPDLRRLVGEVREFADAGTTISGKQADYLMQACVALEPAIDAASDWPTLLKTTLLQRLGELIRALQDCRDLSACVYDPSCAPMHLEPPVRARSERRLHLDPGMALLSAVACVLAILLCCAAWIGTAWPDGAVAAMWAAIGCALFATQDDPAPAIAKFLVYGAVSLPVAALYLFAILPSVDGFPVLALSLAPLLLVIGYLQGETSGASKVLPFIWLFAGILSLQDTFSADFGSFANVGLSSLAGLAAALITTRLGRSVGAGWAAWRILRSGWRELAGLAQAGAAADRAAWTSRMLDRLNLLAPRLALASADGSLVATDALNDLRVGMHVVDLQRARPAIGAVADQAIGRVLKGLGHYFRTASSGRLNVAPLELLGDLDQAISAITANPPSPGGRAGVVALTSLRLDLFHDVPAYQPPSEGAR
ncbi:p-hydroxybenzoic acid efflux pump subunit AaeB [Pararobbsia alpina]|uniref:p-hydroxybenzoic acid efflux pump subunit AaeB n=2 Tax=Pararobbsia alpina TaxID=621374 RepID=A0A6S7BIE5_9BURK|nr:p-hydroxybenzoic acid efflux pump subunit AaeB [Pararobbsia alpina]